MHVLRCLYSTGATVLAATTNQRRPSMMHDTCKFQAKLLSNRFVCTDIIIIIIIIINVKINMT